MKSGELGGLRKEELSKPIKHANDRAEYYRLLMEDNWAEEGVPASQMGRYFKKILPEQHRNKVDGLVRFIEAELKDFGGQAVGLEIGGPGSKLFEEFSEGFFRKTFGVALGDHRQDEVVDADKARHHDVLSLNALSGKGWHQILDELGESKVHFLLERMLGALEGYPKALTYWGAILNRWYKVLAEGGVMLIESPGLDPMHDNEDLLRFKRWLEKMKLQGKEQGVEFEYDEAPPMYEGRFIFRLKKLPGAPSNLPFLEDKAGLGQTADHL